MSVRRQNHVSTAKFILVSENRRGRQSIDRFLRISLSSSGSASLAMKIDHSPMVAAGSDGESKSIQKNEHEEELRC
jgi:hypothetical protein